jgi:hypothetical protein
MTGETGSEARATPARRRLVLYQALSLYIVASVRRSFTFVDGRLISCCSSVRSNVRVLRLIIVGRPPLPCSLAHRAVMHLCCGSRSDVALVSLCVLMSVA